MSADACVLLIRSCCHENYRLTSHCCGCDSGVPPSIRQETNKQENEAAEQSQNNDIDLTLVVT